MLSYILEATTFISLKASLNQHFYQSQDRCNIKFMVVIKCSWLAVAGGAGFG
ncbi:MAG: hypothetical protein JGK26_03350 [Microcoleus sp. PH2017_27_LUM_O_A]|uniref:hypothetical protein n=1 Tax=unclassified Microcoleus TaxID=2642155 RepID=UPI001DE25123|nr:MULTISPECIES: hypothetical protein [unclassified Microcoleus]MCC3458773.1 hypothetical protein [Microcoleus sp. PH2017_11_PCY_U_A]MCC3558169.1 hypothetical protein [Microcoleus sp. PH2017_27_LUM_O_A]